MPYNPVSDINKDFVLAPPQGWIIVYFVIGSFGIAGNICVIIVFLFGKVSVKKNFTIFFIVNQSCLDLTCSILLMAGATDNGEVPWTGIAGDIYCKVWLTKIPLWSLLVSSTYNLVALSYERYLKILHPLWYKFHFSSTKAWISVVIIWTCGLVYNLSYMAPTSVVIDGVCTIVTEWPSKGIMIFVGFLTLLLQFILPLCLLVYAYVKIAMMLHKKMRESDDRCTNVDHITDEIWQRSRNNTIKTLSAVAVSFVLCWSWNQVYYMLYQIGVVDGFTTQFFYFSIAAMYLNCAIGPFIYAIKYKQFQIAAKSIVGVSRLTRADTVTTSQHVWNGNYNRTNRWSPPVQPAIRTSNINQAFSNDNETNTTKDSVGEAKIQHIENQVQLSGIRLQVQEEPA